MLAIGVRDEAVQASPEPGDEGALLAVQITRGLGTVYGSAERLLRLPGRLRRFSVGANPGTDWPNMSIIESYAIALRHMHDVGEPLRAH